MSSAPRDLERAAAKMFCIGFDGQTVPAHVPELLRRGVSGAVLFRRNVEGGPGQVANLCRELKHLAARRFITCVDQEGGRVQRLRQPFTQVPPMRAVGAAGDETLAREVGRLLGRELRALNIDWNLAPVMDVDTNPANPVIADRSPGRTAEVVSRMGTAILAGLHDGGVAACAKHFPGHGDTSQDSHHDLPRLPHEMHRLEAVEMAPFRAAIAVGVDAIMTAHVIFEAVDQDFPATMSRPVLQGILRDRLGFQGVIVTDDLEMKAIAAHHDIGEVVARGAGAGVDLFMIAHDAELQHRAIDALIHAVEHGDVPREALDAAGRRLDVLLDRFALAPSAAVPPGLIGNPSHRAVVDRVVARAGAAATTTGRDPTAFKP